MLGRAWPARLLGLGAQGLAQAGAVAETVPIEMVQSFFFLLDPFLAERKFVRLARLDPDSEAARSFVALEDWINDGVPLGSALARDCLRSWYRDNEPGRGTWRVAGHRMQPRLLRRPGARRHSRPRPDRAAALGRGAGGGARPGESAASGARAMSA